MPSEKEAVHQYLRLEFHMASGFILPDKLCPDCARQLYCLFSGLETIDALLDDPHQMQCWHRLMAVTVLNASLNADPELVEIIGEEMAQLGWDGMPDFGSGFENGDTEIVY